MTAETGEAQVVDTTNATASNATEGRLEPDSERLSEVGEAGTTRGVSDATEKIVRVPTVL